MAKNTQPTESAELKFVRDTCVELETIYDREAVKLICGHLAVDNPGKISQAVERLREAEPGETETQATLHQQIVDSDTTAIRLDALRKLEDLQYTALMESIDTAYLLGIAVGRRIGPAALRLKGGRR